jgi:hypothetical protein
MEDTKDFKDSTKNHQARFAQQNFYLKIIFLSYKQAAMSSNEDTFKNGDFNGTNRLNDPENMSIFVIVRHGERLDYVEQEQGRNWVASNQDRPWDPPLTQHGQWQAQQLGQEIERILKRYALPSVSHVYTSPLWRCRQTAQQA